MTRHPNAAMILQVAQWIAEGETEFQYAKYPPNNPDVFDWTDLVGARSLIEGYAWALEGRKVRLKPKPPKTIKIGEFECPEPMREKPNHGDWVYFVDISAIHGARSTDAIRFHHDTAWMVRAWREGMVYRTSDDSCLCAKAILSLLKPKEEI